MGHETVPATLTRKNGALLIFAFTFLVLLSGAAFAGKLPFAVAVIYLAASIAAFIAYALDKSAAQNGQWRISERTLHLVALAGGWPGALAAQRLLRHKSRKQSFQVVFWSTVVVNCAALGWLFSAPGAAALRTMLGGVAG